MKYILHITFALFFLVCVLESSFGQGDAPALIQGQGQTSKSVGAIIKVPGKSATKLSGSTTLIETGNKNILANPSLEHPTVPSGSANASSWIASATSISLSTAAIDGSQALLLVSSAAAITATQDSTLYASELDDGVQCLAQVRVKGDVALQVCARQAGVTSTTDCVTTNTDNKWGLYKVPFICGATSNGVSIASSGSVTGGAYIDDAFVGAVDLKTDTNNVGPWRSFTPTGSWSTNTTYTGKYRQVGENLEVQVKWSTSGAPTSASLDINLPSGFTIDTSKIASGTDFTEVKGSSGGINDSATTFFAAKVYFLTASVTAVRAVVDVSSSTYANVNSVTQIAPMTWGASDSGYVNFSVPVTQFAGSSSIYSASCGANCVDTFSALVTDGSSTTTVSNENADFINGNCTNPSAGNYTCTFNSGIFTVAPNCTVTPTSANVIPTVTSASNQVQFGFVTRADAATPSDTSFIFSCQKQGSDFVATRTIVGSFNEVATTPGVSKPVSFSYRTTATCTTGTCAGENMGSVAVSASFNSTGNYTATIPSGVCSSTPYCQGGSTATVSNDNKCNTNATSATSVAIICRNNANSSVNEGFKFECTCEAP